MNLRKVGNYNIGLDLGTGSVGWAVTDEDGELLHFKGRPTWGSRVFPTAETAAATRLKRGQRRRYERRRWRLNLLQGIFSDEMANVDDEFFIRLSQARLLMDDRNASHANYRWPLFNDSDFTERAYYKRFPTIYHLRAWLMETDEAADLRLVYLAFHNIVKTRGNFLHQDNPSLSAESADMGASVSALCAALAEWCDGHEIACSCKTRELQKALEDPTTPRGAKQETIMPLFGFDPDREKLMGKHLSKALVGYSAEFARIFGDEPGDGTKFKLSEDEKVENYLSSVPDEGLALFDAIREVYSAFVLAGILDANDGAPIFSGALQGAAGKSISYCKVREYEQYKKDLSLLKELVCAYLPKKKYEEFFRGEFYPDTHDYNPSEAKGYTKYDSQRTYQYEDFKKDVKDLFNETDATSDTRYVYMMARFEEERFLRRLKTSDNGSIPYQLHLEEMDAIITRQGRFHPFLLEEKEKIESLVSFRIPYYVGPLTQKNAALDDAGKPRFAWAVRKPGKEGVPVYPWNWEEVIDKNGSAHRFINRMTSDCTYLLNQPVLPKCSLLYEEFCVLNELNGARWTQDGDDARRFDAADRAGIIEGLFKQKKTVSYKAVSDWLREQRGWTNVHVAGGQGETKFESGLSSYRFFCKDVFQVDSLPESDVPMVETIILWSTLFEDRSILKEELERNFSDRLTSQQIKKICNKRLTGWGRLSERFLTGLKASTDNGPKSILDVLREGSPTSGEHARAMVLMEVLHDENLGFEKLIEQENEKELAKVDHRLEVGDLSGSPALHRPVNQATRIVEEITRIAGHAPANVFIEVTRDEDPRNKGRRTKRRYDQLKEALHAFKKEGAEAMREFRDVKPEDLDDERLTLYFMQGGKSLYSGKPLDINRLSEYQVDHIIPQSYIKDDSFENKALVLSRENQAKTDNVLSKSIRRKMSNYWRALYQAKLIGDKKFNNLINPDMSDRRIKGFIARQLVETSQVVKLTKLMLESRLPQSRVLPIRASLSHQLREAKGYVKCREINDFHHAHDALLAAEVGRFILKRHQGMYDNPIGYAHVVRDFVRVQAKEAKQTGRMPGSAGFIVSSFLRSGFDKDTGEIFKEDDWDAEFECERIRRFLNYKQVFISHMPEETSGKFWKATIYSPRNRNKDGSLKGPLPLKQGSDSSKWSDPSKYGGFSDVAFAYFFIYEVQDGKSGKHRLVFSTVPVRVASLVESDADALARFARKEAQVSGKEFVRIVRSKVYKYQQIEVGQDRFYIRGKEEVRNARQFAFSQEETALIAKLVAWSNKPESAESLDTDTLLSLFNTLQSQFSARAPELGTTLKLSGLAETFREAKVEDKAEALLALISIAAAIKNKINLTSIGGAANSGCMHRSLAKLLNNSQGGITFIDQSVTGMLERKTPIGL